MSAHGTDVWTEADRRDGIASAVPSVSPSQASGPLALMRLAGPLIVSRAGLATMGIVNMMLVSHVSATELAETSLSEGTFGRLVDVCVAFMASSLVLFATMRRTTDRQERSALWRQMALLSFVLGGAAFVVSLFAPTMLWLLGQPEALTAGTARIIAILGPGVPAGLLAIASAVFLEGTGRASLVTKLILVANVLNFAVGYALVGGHFGAPALGAAGAAISTDVVRVALAATLSIAVLRGEGPAILQRGPLSPELERDHWRLALSASGTTGGLHMMGVLLTIFAGWLGSLDLAAYASCWIINLPGMLLIIGLGDALGMRATQNRLSPKRNAIMRGDLASLALVLLTITSLIVFNKHFISLAYTSDPALAELLARLLPLSGMVLLIDGLAIGMISILRSLKDVKVPMLVQIVTMVVTPALAALFAFGFGPVSPMGVIGMVTAVLVTSTVRCILVGCRLIQRAMQLT